MTGLEILHVVAYGHTLFHRDRDAYDLIDQNGLVAAVLCPRKTFLAVSLPAERVPPKPVGRRIPYGEKVAERITSHDIEAGRLLLDQLAAGEKTERRA